MIVKHAPPQKKISQFINSKSPYFSVLDDEPKKYWSLNTEDTETLNFAGKFI